MTITTCTTFRIGQRPWTTSRELAELMQGPERLRRLAPIWPALFWDLSAQSPEELLRSSGAWLQALAVVRAEEAERDEFERVFLAAIGHLEPLAGEDKIRWHDLMWFVLSWAFRRRPSDENRRLKDLAMESHHERQFQKEIDQMSQSIGQKWEDFIFEKGEMKGAVTASRELVRECLEHRFGPLLEDVVQRLEAISDPAQLKSLMHRAMDAESLDDLEF